MRRGRKMKKLGAAIVGCGTIASLHADGIIELDQVELRGVVDPKKERREKFSKEYQCPAYECYEEVLQNPDIQVVHICTPHYLHKPMIIQGIIAGKHVIVEKPVVMNPTELAEVKKTMELYPDSQVAVIFQNRYNDTTQKAKSMIDNKEIGELVGMKGLLTWYRSEAYYQESDWRGKWETEGGGVLINQAIHTLDLMQFLGGELESIKGHVDTRSLQHIIEVEDTAEATLYFKNGCRGIFYATNSYTENSPIEIELHGTEGTLSLRNQQLHLYKNGEKHLVAEDEMMKKGKAYWGCSHEVQVADFYRCLIEKEPYCITPKEGGVAIEMIHGIYESHRTGEAYIMKEAKSQ